MEKAPCRQRLALEADQVCGGVRFGEQLLADDLDRHLPFQDGIEPLVDDPHRALSEQCVDAVLSECFGYVHELPARQPGRAFQVSSMRIAFSRLRRSEEHTSELQSLMRKPYAVFC